MKSKKMKFEIGQEVKGSNPFFTYIVEREVSRMMVEVSVVNLIGDHLENVRHIVNKGKLTTV